HQRAIRHCTLPPMSWNIPIRTGLPALCLALVLLGGTNPARASVSDFRLPPDPAAQEPPPTRQGPVVPDVPESRGTPAPEPAPSPQATSSAAPPIVVPALPAATPAPDDRGAPAAPVRRPSADAPAPRGAPAPAPPSAPSSAQATPSPEDTQTSAAPATPPLVAP